MKRNDVSSSRQKICLVSCLFSTGAIQAQFTPVESTGLPYHVIVSQVFIDSATAPVGTQIGIFDGDLCVGAESIDYEGQENIDVVTWEGSASPYLPGFSPGNAITAQLISTVYDTELNMSAELTLDTGNGTFGYGSYTVVSISASSGLAPDIVSVSGAVDLGAVQVGSSDSTQVAIFNQGNVSLSVLSVGLTSEVFTVSDYNGELAQGDTIEFGVVFAPTDTGQVSDNIIVVSNDPDHPSLVIPVSAYGALPAPVCNEDIPDISLDEDSGPDTLHLSLNEHFTDSYSATLDFFVVSSDTTQLEAQHLGEIALVVEPQPNWFGVSNIYVGATNGSFTAYDTVLVTVNGVNDAPEAFNLVMFDTLYIGGGGADTGSTSLSWSGATDIEGDSIAYFVGASLEPVPSSGDSGILNLNFETNATQVWISHSVLYEVMADQGLLSSELLWDVVAYDGQDSTWSSNGPFVTIVDISDALETQDNLVFAASYGLAQNYPNPFNPSTTIGFSVEKFGDVSIRIFDIVGHPVVTLIGGPVSPGFHKTIWNARGVSSGTYFVQMRSGDFVKTQKMILLK